jgi:hypothetical protein
METNPILLVGTSGHSMWFSKDMGETWGRGYAEAGLYPECAVYAIAPDQSDPDRLYLGTNRGIRVWRFSAGRFEHLPSQLDAMPVWSLAQSPHDPAVLYAGTQYPAALFKSVDFGCTWTKMNVEFAQTCPLIGDPRVTQIVFHPWKSGVVWAGVEIDGVYRSLDDGKSWEKTSAGLVSEDMHWLAFAGHKSEWMFATTNKGVHRSADGGQSWKFLPFESPWSYTRAIVPSAQNPETLFLCNGNGPPGSTGRLLRSDDLGVNWAEVSLPAKLNSTPWCIATTSDQSNVMVLCSNLGQMFISTDTGLSWKKLERELGEIKSALLISKGART